MAINIVWFFCLMYGVMYGQKAVKYVLKQMRYRKVYKLFIYNCLAKILL